MAGIQVAKCSAISSPANSASPRSRRSSATSSDRLLSSNVGTSTATLTVRTDLPGEGVLVRQATVSRIVPGTAAWDTVVPLLHDKRLNAPDGEQQPERWARESVVLRLEPSS